MVDDGFFLAVGENKKVKTEFEIIDLKDLKFYPFNPRISSLLVNQKEKVSDKEIEKLMWEKQPEATKTLYHQIKKDGHVNEPLTIYEHQALEGNTRLCVLRKLYEETKDKKWIEVPCRVIIEKLDKTQIDYILCNYHIKKKKDWEPYEQACYFYKMNKQDKLSYQDIAKLTDVNFIKVMDYIKTFAKMLRDKAEPAKFSAYYEVIKAPECKRAMKADPDLVEKVIKKFDQGKIKESKDVRKMKVILKDPATTKKFFNSGMDIYAAEKRALHRLPAEADPLLKDLTDLAESFGSLPNVRLEEIKKDKRKKEIIKNFVNDLKRFCKLLKIKV